MLPTLVIGASRGLGRGFVEQLLARGESVYATTRRPQDAEALVELAAGLGGDAPTRLRTFELDVADPASREAFFVALGEQPIGTVIYNAGIYGPRGLAPGELPEQEWLEVLHVDTVAPLMVAQGLLPHLRAAATTGTTVKLAFLTSLMGSIADNGSGGSYLYRSAKAGLNAAVRSLALDLAEDDIAVRLLHPGWVRTDMGGAQAPLDIDTSVAGMLARIDELDASLSGTFVDWSGSSLPW